jgi:hypothetical protein
VVGAPAGHELRTQSATLGTAYSVRRQGMAVCECGAYSTCLPSDYDRRLWHREHLEAVARGLTTLYQARR